MLQSSFFLKDFGYSRRLFYRWLRYLKCLHGQIDVHYSVVDYIISLHTRLTRDDGTGKLTKLLLQIRGSVYKWYTSLIYRCNTMQENEQFSYNILVSHIAVLTPWRQISSCAKSEPLFRCEIWFSPNILKTTYAIAVKF